MRRMARSRWYARATGSPLPGITRASESAAPFATPPMRWTTHSHKLPRAKRPSPAQPMANPRRKRNQASRAEPARRAGRSTRPTQRFACSAARRSLRIGRAPAAPHSIPPPNTACSAAQEKKVDIHRSPRIRWLAGTFGYYSVVPSNRSRRPARRERSIMPQCAHWGMILFHKSAGRPEIPMDFWPAQIPYREEKPRSGFSSHRRSMASLSRSPLR